MLVISQTAVDVNIYFHFYADIKFDIRKYRKKNYNAHNCYQK